MRRGCDDLHRVGSPEPLLRVIRDNRTNNLAGDRSGNEHHTPLVAGDHDTTVGYRGNRQLDDVTQMIAHPHSLGGPVRLYLASTSPARLATLRAVGIDPVVVPSNLDEEDAIAGAGELTPEQTVLLLARLKAQAVSGGNIDGFILGGDSLFEMDGRVYGKPHTAAAARERWELQRGRTGILHSGHWVIDHRGGVTAGATGAVSSASVTFASDLTGAEIDGYIATGEPLHVAGAFTIDSLGAPFITTVTGDPHTVVGVSPATLRHLLRKLGAEWTDVAHWGSSVSR